MDLPQTQPGVPAPNVDPTVSELEAISTIAHIIAWLGSSDEVAAALGTAMGTSAPKLRDVVFINAAEWDAVLATVKVPTPLDDGAVQPPRDLTPVEVGHLSMVRRICRLRLGLTAKEEQPNATTPLVTADGLAATSQPQPPGAAVAQSSVEPVVKLNVVLDPSLDAPLVRIPQGEIRRMFSDYKTERGAEPAEDVCPTEEQISAVKQVLDCDRWPFACFSIWGPYGRRMLTKMAYLAYVFLPNGKWQKTELPGPPTFEHWWAAWRVFRVSLLLLKAVPPELLDNYADLIRRFATQYQPKTWFLVCQAEARMRSEHFERLRRKAERIHEAASSSSATSEFDPKHPWATVFSMAVGEECKHWWDDNLHRDAMLFLTHVRSAADVTDDGTAQPILDMPVQPPPLPQAEPKRRRLDQPQGGAAQAKGRRGGKAQSAAGSAQKVTGPIYTTANRQFCDFFNNNERCRYTEDTCNHFHGCKQCRAQGHPQSDCPLLGGSGRSKAKEQKQQGRRTGDSRGRQQQKGGNWRGGGQY